MTAGEDWGDVDRREWPFVGGPMVAMRDTTISPPVPHEFDPYLDACVRCGRSRYDEVDDTIDCIPSSPTASAIDYFAITRDMVAGA